MSVLASLAAAIWLGLVTSISPCPLATNIAATSFLARRLESQRRGVLGVLASRDSGSHRLDHSRRRYLSDSDRYAEGRLEIIGPWWLRGTGK